MIMPTPRAQAAQTRPQSPQSRAQATHSTSPKPLLLLLDPDPQKLMQMTAQYASYADIFQVNPILLAKDHTIVNDHGQFVNRPPGMHACMHYTWGV